MRIMVLFDLPVLTEKQRRDYREFRKYLLKAGFFMMQESVYCKLVQNAGVADVVQESIRKNKPGEGLVQILRVTEKQFATVADTTDSNKPPHDGMIYDVNEGTWIDMPEVHPDGFDRSAAEEVWSYVNAERTAAGLNALTWDEDIYNFACQRAQAIVSDFSHNGCGNYGENIALNSAGSAYRIHMQWKILHWKKVKTVVERYPAMPMDRRQKQL